MSSHENFSAAAYPGWSTRGYLPHFDDGITIQFLTWRLNDSLPASALERLSNEPQNPAGDAEYRRRLEAWLDAGHGSCLLRTHQAASIVQNALLHFDRVRYDLHAWCVMPNHVHVLLQEISPYSIQKTEHSWKSFTAHEINKAMGRTGKLWQKDGWDRFIRDEEHYANTIRYIEQNPVKARLCRSPVDWPWCSAAYTLKEAL